MMARARRLGKITLGWLLLVLGVAGLFLPVLQGVAFLALGLAVLASEQIWARRLLTWLRDRFPRFAAAADQARLRGEQWWRKISRGRGRPS